MTENLYLIQKWESTLSYGGLCQGGLIWSNTRVKKKVGLAVGWGSLHVYAEKYGTYSKGCQASSVQMFQ